MLFPKFLLLVLNMFWLTGILFQVKKLATGAYGSIIYRVVGLGPQFLRDEIRVCFTPFQRVKQTHGFLHLFLNRQFIILLFLWVQVGS